MTRLVEDCGGCGSHKLTSVLALGISPPTCVMVPIGATVVEEPHPLELVRCDDCSLVQLSVIVDPETVFPPDYPYSSGNSKGLHQNFQDLAEQASRWTALSPDDLVVDIGANDGTLLDKFTDCRTVGVEPTGQARRIAGPAYEEFFTEELAHRIVAEHGHATIVTACNVLAHVEDIGDVMRGIHVLLSSDGMLVAENHDLLSVVDGRQWDTVYHEHLRFYDPLSFYSLLRRHGLGAQSWQPVATHGGSFRMLAGKGREPRSKPPHRRVYDFEGLARDAAQARNAIRAATLRGVVDVTGFGGPREFAPCAAAPMVGIGATARATTIINYCGLTVEDLDYVCEVSGSDKIGHYIPGTSIPVVDEARLFTEQPPRALLFSWHLADVIVPKLRERGYTGEIIVPLPTLRSL